MPPHFQPLPSRHEVLFWHLRNKRGVSNVQIEVYDSDDEGRSITFKLLCQPSILKLKVILCSSSPLYA
jgi:hypothetical protein